MKYDLVIFGGGTSGVACAYIAAKHGINTLLVEKTDTLGGAATQGLVIPSMKTDTKNINVDFINSLLYFADKYRARHKYIDGNELWLNPELLKIVLDDMLLSVKCNVLFSSCPVNIDYSNSSKNFSIELSHKLLSLYIDTDYIVDASGDGIIFKMLNCNFQENSIQKQTSTLRFIMSGVDVCSFADWIEEYDSDRTVTTVDRSDNQIHLSTAYTWDNTKKWALKPIFDKAINDGILENTDCAYFQIFTIPNMPGAVAFNCPRVLLDDDENLLDPFVYSRALFQARKRIYRLSNFCKKYLKGFENSYISNIADMLGIRESYRVKGKYTFKKDDILNPKQYDNVAFACDYPIDIHSNSSSKDILHYTNTTYYVPTDALISEQYDNLYAIGRIVSSEFEAQAAIRTQRSCFSMGEAAAKDIIAKINLNKKQ